MLYSQHNPDQASSCPVFASSLLSWLQKETDLRTVGVAHQLKTFVTSSSSRGAINRQILTDYHSEMLSKHLQDIVQHTGFAIGTAKYNISAGRTFAFIMSSGNNIIWERFSYLIGRIISQYVSVVLAHATT